MNEGRIRLACTGCDRSDFDGVQRVPKSWADVHRVQSYRDSKRVVPDGDPSFSVLEWYTHLGTCPDCQVEVK